MPYRNDHTVPAFTYDQKYSSCFVDNSSPWIRRDPISLTDADYSIEDEEKYPLKEKNLKNIHVPHKDKPPQAVARRNARERRRVHAVNMAFVRLRKMIPIHNSRGKRISKVKTLQQAIKYIKELEIILKQEEKFDRIYSEATQCWHYRYEDYWYDYTTKQQ